VDVGGNMAASEADLDAMLDDALAEIDESDSDDEPVASPAPESTRTLDPNEGKSTPKDNNNGNDIAQDSPAGPDGATASSAATDEFLNSFSKKLMETLASDATDGKMSEELKELQKAMGDMSELTKLREQLERQGGPGEQNNAKPAGGVDEALKNLSEGLKEMPQQSEEDALKTLLSELEKLDMGDESGEGVGGMDSFIDSMISKMMSKEYLYPAVKEITGKFPEFMKENEGKASEEKMKQYQDQYKCFQELCEVFENSKPNDEGDDKKVMDLMQKMQSYGPPPQEIMSGLLPGVQFDKEGMPKLPDLGGLENEKREDCSLM